MIGTTGSKWGTSEKSRASAKGASVERVYRKVSFNIKCLSHKGWKRVE